MSNNTPNFQSVVEGTVNRLVEKNLITVVCGEQASLALVAGTFPMYLQQGDFTVVLLQNADTERAVAVGVSKRNPLDQKNLLRGRSLALSRAIKEFVINSVRTDKIEVEKQTSRTTKDKMNAFSDLIKLHTSS